MASALYTDVKRKEGHSIFIRPHEGLFGLREWADKGLVFKVPCHMVIALATIFVHTQIKAGTLASRVYIYAAFTFHTASVKTMLCHPGLVTPPSLFTFLAVFCS